MKFNLLDEKWMPTNEGNVSFQEAFTNAHKIVEIYDERPTVTISLYRLMLAILYRSLNNLGGTQWKSLWEEGKFPQDVSDYLSKHKDGFWLFHEERPFYQIIGEKKMETPITKLALDLGEKEPTWFNHERAARKDWTYGEAAKILIAAQNFNYTDTPSSAAKLNTNLVAGKLLVLLKGDNLFETLMLNLLTPGYVPELFKSDNQRSLPWEKWRMTTMDKIGKEATDVGDCFTWQHRRIKLKDDGNSVSSIFMEGGENLTDSQKQCDPMFCLVKTIKKKQEEIGPLKTDENKPLWRNGDNLLAYAKDEGVCAFRQAVDFLSHGLRRPKKLLRCATFFLFNDKAKIKSWAHQELLLGEKTLSDRSYLSDIKTSIEVVNASYEELNKTLYGKKLNLKLAMIKQIKKKFWQMLERPFNERLANSSSFGDEWKKICDKTVENSIGEIQDVFLRVFAKHELERKREWKKHKVS